MKRVIGKILKLSPYEYYQTHLKIVSAVLPNPFTGREIEVLASFMASEPSLIEDDMFNTLVRKKVKKKLKLSDGGLGNHLKSMVDKGWLIRNEITGNLKVRELLFAGDSSQMYKFKLVKDEK